MGLALANLANKPAATLDDWSREIANVEDTPEATAALQGLLRDPRFAGLFTSFLKNDSVNGSSVSAAALVQDKVWLFSQSAASLDPPWGHPPHPGGDDVVRLIDHLKGFRETGTDG
jgi:hypothetical protein